MEIKRADVSNAPIMYDLMMQAFMEYKDEVPPSSALEETEETIAKALAEEEKAFIAYINEQPVGMVRFKLNDNTLYFYRLSVLPEMQGQGIAKKLLNYLESYAENINVTKIICKVRKNVPRNMQLYHSLGFTVFHEEVIERENGVHLTVVSMMKQLADT